MISAKVIADSKNEFGNRLTTMIVTMPRIILAEFNTHRMFSRNSASSRAIPFNKMVESVIANPFIPIAWQKDHKGMQGIEYLDNTSLGKIFDYQLTDFVPATLSDMWRRAKDDAVNTAIQLNKAGVTKQLCNRLLEPFMWVDVVATATRQAWVHYFAQRCAHDAQPEHQHLAKMIARAYMDSVPRQLDLWDWHTPYIAEEELSTMPMSNRMACSVVRVRRVSWKPFDGKPETMEAAWAKHDESRDAGHWSCFEHQGQAVDDPSIRSGRMRGFLEYRQMLPVSVHTDFDFTTLD